MRSETAGVGSAEASRSHCGVPAHIGATHEKKTSNVLAKLLRIFRCRLENHTFLIGGSDFIEEKLQRRILLDRVVEPIQRQTPFEQDFRSEETRLNSSHLVISYAVF